MSVFIPTWTIFLLTFHTPTQFFLKLFRNLLKRNSFQIGSNFNAQTSKNPNLPKFHPESTQISPQINPNSTSNQPKFLAINNILRSRKRFSSESDVTHEIHDNQLPPSRDRLCSTGLCSSGLDSLPEIEDLKIEEEA